MRLMGKILKWIVGIIMAIILVAGVADLCAVGIVGQIMPTGIDDLAWANVTLKNVTSTPSGLTFAAQDYPTVFVITLIPPPANINDLVKPGDKVAFRIKKEEADHLQNAKVEMAYGLQLANGQQLFDNTAMIMPIPDGGKSKISHFFWGMILVPTFYFLALVSGPPLWRKIKKRSAGLPQ